MILGIETSCDDTSVALLTPERRVIGQLSVSQDDSHRPFGGVVPEVASRRHTENLLPLIEKLFAQTQTDWSHVRGIAATSRPGLIGSLLVGLVTAKTLSLVRGIPFVGVNHIAGHLLAPLLIDDQYVAPKEFGFPFLGLAVSGGHTHLFEVKQPGEYKLLGQTVDDAAGEAFDKFAKMLGLGFPGGVRVDQNSVGGDVQKFAFPRGLLHSDDLNFSFSGLKTAAQRTLHDLTAEERELEKKNLCASFQEAVVDVLIAKLRRASTQTGLKNWAVTGGVSANSRLRQKAAAAAQDSGAVLALPPLRYCTDNAAMIALVGHFELLKNPQGSPQDLSPGAASTEADWQ